MMINALWHDHKVLSITVSLTFSCSRWLRVFFFFFLIDPQSSNIISHIQLHTDYTGTAFKGGKTPSVWCVWALLRKFIFFIICLENLIIVPVLRNFDPIYQYIVYESSGTRQLNMSEFYYHQFSFKKKTQWYWSLRFEDFTTVCMCSGSFA